MKGENIILGRLMLHLSRIISEGIDFQCIYKFNDQNSVYLFTYDTLCCNRFPYKIGIIFRTIHVS